MDKDEGTVRSRELGEGLRRAMVNAKLNGQDIARILGWSQSWVSRLLSGKRNATEVNVAEFLAVCRVKGKERKRLLDLCKELDVPGWLQKHGSALPKDLHTYIDHENRAVKISDFQPIVIPGLLQTGDYAQTVISHGANVPAGEVEDRVAARLARQSVLSRDRPPKLTFFVHEHVLRTPVGGRDVMSEQLHHLLRLSVRTYLALRVIPTALGAHAAMAGPFSLLEFADLHPVTYLENETYCLFLELPEETAAYQRILAALAETALSEGQSRELIADLATELYADRGNRDDRS